VTHNREADHTGQKFVWVSPEERSAMPKIKLLPLRAGALGSGGTNTQVDNCHPGEGRWWCCRKKDSKERKGGPRAGWKEVVFKQGPIKTNTQRKSEESGGVGLKRNKETTHYLVGWADSPGQRSKTVKIYTPTKNLGG